MSDSEEHRDRRIVLSFVPRTVVVLVLLFALTGNCGTCGFDKDYLGALVGLEGGGE